MLKGCTPEIIAQNKSDLIKGGMSEKQATHLSLKHANKHRPKAKKAKTEESY